LNEEEEPEDEGILVDCEIHYDSIGVSHFLMSRRCKNCDD